MSNHRTRPGVPAGVVCLVVLALWGIPSMFDPALAEEWPRWRGPRGDGTWQGPQLPDAWPEEELPVRWRRPIGGGYAGVSVADGRVYTLDRQTEPDEVERVLCFDATDGQLIWSHQYPVRYGDLDYGNGPRAAPTIHAGRVYTLGTMGHAMCLEAKSGRVCWSKDFVADHRAEVPTWGLAASPVVWRDRVIFHAGLRPDGCFTAHDLKTGHEVWRSGSDPAGYATPIVVAAASGEQLIGWTPEHVIGMAPQTGKQLWSIPYKISMGVSIATPIFAEDTVLVSSYWHGAKAIRLGEKSSDAELIWKDTRALRGLMSQPLFRDGHAYLLERQHGLTCFRLATGEILWSEAKAEQRMTPRARNPQASLIWLGKSNRALILNSAGELILARIDPRGYHEQSRTKIIGRTWAHPAFAGRHVFARSDSELVCVELPQPTR